MKAGELYGYHSGAPTESEYARGSKELLENARAPLQERGARRAGDESRPAARAPRAARHAEPDQRLQGRARRAGRPASRHRRARRRPREGLRPRSVRAEVSRTGSSSAASPSRTWCRWPAASHIAARCPIVHSFACFLSARPNEQIYNQCSEASKVIYVGSLAGLLPGGPGHSHQSVRDISALAAVPNLRDGGARGRSRGACARSTIWSATASESAYLRLVSVKWPVPFAYPAGQRVQPGRGWVVRDGRDLVVDRLRSVAAVERLARGGRPRANGRCDDAPDQPAVAESRRSRLAAGGDRRSARGGAARQPLRARRPGRDGRGGRRRSLASSRP